MVGWIGYILSFHQRPFSRILIIGSFLEGRIFPVGSSLYFFRCPWSSRDNPLCTQFLADMDSFRSGRQPLLGLTAHSCILVVFLWWSITFRLSLRQANSDAITYVPVSKSFGAAFSLWLVGSTKTFFSRRFAEFAITTAAKIERTSYVCTVFAHHCIHSNLCWSTYLSVNRILFM